MAGRGKGRQGDGQGDNQLPQAFDQQAFMEAIGVAATTIAQANAMVSQGGSSNIQRFKTHRPPTFKGGGDPIISDHWF